MESLMLEWFNLVFRFLHVVTAIAWIGASFYFIWLDLSLREPPAWKAAQGVKGDLWAIHGGGIYEVAKYHLRPAEMPSQLHWFKWEAYSTWLTGSGLLILMYYLQAQTYLIGHNTWIQTPGMAIAASLGFILGGQAVYELLLRTPLVHKGLVFALSLLVFISFASWLAAHLFSARAAYLHIGAMIATWMAGNVFWGIVPAQKNFVAAVSNNQPPDECAMLFARLRSTHNNYLTLPVIFCMISNHYAFVYGHQYAWLALLAIGGCLVTARHFFNLKHRGVVKPALLVISALGILCTSFAMAYSSQQAIESHHAAQANAAHASSDIIQPLISQHCANCHSQTPRQPGFAAPPAGLIINTPEQLASLRVRALPALSSGYMPLGNFQHLTEQERASLIAWLQSQEQN